MTWGIRNEVVLGLLAGAVGGAVVAIPAYLGANREMDVKMVEIPVGILSQEPKDNIAPAREWAVEVISHYADVKLSPEVRDALIGHRVLSGQITSGGGRVECTTYNVGTPNEFSVGKLCPP